MDPSTAHSTAFSTAQVITILVAAVGGISVIGAVFALGFWEKFIKSRVRDTIKTYEAEPENQASFEKRVDKVIDNSINRRDGAIQLEINKQVTDGNREVLAEVQKLRTDLSGVADVGKRLGHIEGSMAVIMSALRVQPPVSSVPPEPDHGQPRFARPPPEFQPPRQPDR